MLWWSSFLVSLIHSQYSPATHILVMFETARESHSLRKGLICAGFGGGKYTFEFIRSKPVLLFPRWCFALVGVSWPRARGLDGRPIVHAFLGGAGGPISGSGSSGVGGSRAGASALLTVGRSSGSGLRDISSTDSDLFDDLELLSCVTEAGVMVATLSLLLFFDAGGIGGNGPFFPPRGPTPKSARLLNFFVDSGTAFRFTTGDDRDAESL